MNKEIGKELEETAISFLKWARNTLENEPATSETVSLVPSVVDVTCTMIAILKDQRTTETHEKFAQEFQQKISIKLNELMNSYHEQLTKKGSTTFF